MFEYIHVVPIVMYDSIYFINCAVRPDENTSPVEVEADILPIIKVSNIPQGASEDLLTNFFENKRRSGGDDIDEIDYDEGARTAIITFKDPEGILLFNLLEHNIMLSC